MSTHLLRKHGAQSKLVDNNYKPTEANQDRSSSEVDTNTNTAVASSVTSVLSRKRSVLCAVGRTAVLSIEAKTRLAGRAWMSRTGLDK
jgi:hypothetical protein